MWLCWQSVLFVRILPCICTVQSNNRCHKQVCRMCAILIHAKRKRWTLVEFFGLNVTSIISLIDGIKPNRHYFKQMYDWYGAFKPISVQKHADNYFTSSDSWIQRAKTKKVFHSIHVLSYVSLNQRDRQIVQHSVRHDGHLTKWVLWTMLSSNSSNKSAHLWVETPHSSVSKWQPRK